MIDELVTLGFMDQVLYHTAVRESLVGIDPRTSTMVFELTQFRYMKIGTCYTEGTKALNQAAEMRQVILENHARVKTLSTMIGDGKYTEEEIAAYILELYQQSEEALVAIEELNG